MTGNEKTAKDIENLLGEKKEAQESYSHQAGGNNSVTESLQKEKVLKARDIAGQAAGHFIGKIAGGKPPFFSVQMDMCRFEEKEIPRFSLPSNWATAKKRWNWKSWKRLSSRTTSKSLKMSTPSSKR